MKTNPTITLPAAFEIKIPSVPNYFMSAKKEEQAERRSFPIQDFDDSLLQLVGEAWTRNLIATAQQRRSAPRS